jgi:hypothetical protein
MSKWLKALGLAAVVAVVAVLVPLYGDPRLSAVTHAEWARMLLRGLAMDAALRPGAQASHVFSILSWKDSLSFGAEAYLHGENVSVVTEGGARRVVAPDEAGEVAYPLAVVRGGDYRLRVRIGGDPATPAAAEITRVGETKPSSSFTLVPQSLAGWVDAGTEHLDPGLYTASILLPKGSSLERVEVAPPCLSAIEPPGGWRATAVVQTTDVAVTAVKALDMESELPPAAAPIELGGSHFQNLGPTITLASGSEGLEKFWVKAGPGGRQASVFVELPERGLYTVSVFGTEVAAQSWRADSCQKAVLCGSPTAAALDRGAQWRTVMTTEFAAGGHFFTVNLAGGGAIGRLRLERKKASPDDYLATLRRLGFDPGPNGPISRSKAVDAMAFIQGTRMKLLAAPCGDVPSPAAVTTADRGLAEPVTFGTSAGPGVGSVGLPPPGPGSVSVPPQLPASPVLP